MIQSNEKKILFLIPVPLSFDTQHQVLSPQIKEVVASLSVFLVENIRSARRFISSLQLGISIDSLQFFELTKDTPANETLKHLKAAPTSVGVLSEAGCPGIADPGAVAAQIAHELGWQVRPLVGPSSILLALMASGFSGQQFAFHGYLPIDKNECQQTIKKLEKEALTKRQTQIFMETPYRNNQLMQQLVQGCSGSTLLCVAADLTSENEFIATKSIREWQKALPDLHKKPTIFLIGTNRNNF